MMNLFEFRLDIQNYILSIAFFLNIILSVIIFTNSKRSRSEIAFAILASSVAMWALGMFLYRGVSTDYLALSVTKFYYLFAGVIPSSFLYFSYYYQNRENDFGLLSRRIIALTSIVSIFLPLMGDFVVSNVVVQNVGENKIYFGPGLFMWGTYTIFYFFLAFYILFRKYLRNRGDISLRNQFRLIITGSLISVLIGFTTNHILPLFFHDPNYAWLGPSASLFMTCFIAIAIYKHHLFNAKLIVTEILIFFVWISLLINLLISVSLNNLFSNLLVFIIVLVLGIFVINSVIREVTQREALALANAGQENLIHIINHQIKGYLSKSRNIFSELLTEPDYGPIPERSKPMIKEGFESLTEGVHFTEQLLNASSVEKGTFAYNMDKINFKEVVLDVFARQKEICERKSLGYSLEVADGKYEIDGDKIQLKEVIRNLIDNSISYTPTGSIKVSLQDKGNSVCLSIKDTGVGLSESDRSRLFSKGGRGEESLKINVNSTGYGLYFVKSVIDAHGGKIWAESDGRGKGSTFSVELPKSGSINGLLLNAVHG